MNCREFESVVADLARGRGPEESVRREAAAHACGCAECASRLAAERELAGALSSLAAAVAGRQAPARVETALLEAFDNRRAAAPVRRGSAMLRWVLAAAAVLVFVAVAAWLWRPRPASLPAVARRPPVPVQIAEPPEAPRRQPGQPNRVGAVHFYPLAPVSDLTEVSRGAIVRVTMPRSAMVSFGWPPDPDNAYGRVEAEVVLDGDTGMARAIRFVGSRP